MISLKQAGGEGRGGTHLRAGAGGQGRNASEGEGKAMLGGRVGGQGDDEVGAKEGVPFEAGQANNGKLRGWGRHLLHFVGRCNGAINPYKTLTLKVPMVCWLKHPM